MIIKTLLVTGLAAAALGAGLMPAGAVADAAAVNRAGYLAFVETVLNKGDVPASDRFFETDLIDHAPWPGHPATLAGFKEGLLEMRASFPDFHVEVERTVAEGDMLVAHLKMSGSQLGAFMGKPASGKTFNVEAVDIVRMKDGKIAEHWGVIDAAAMGEQLGL